jgi:prepilin-type processing-associated H-X9-DG protein
MIDAVVISDTHLGSDVCQSKLLIEFLEKILSGEMPAARLVINGDLFDSCESRLKRKHWKVLALIGQIARDIETVWIQGNHDVPDAEQIAALIGVTLAGEYTFESDGKKVYCVHGDAWDNFITERPFITWLADRMYSFAQWLDKSHGLARFLKRNSKTFLRCAGKIATEALSYAGHNGYDFIFCGHVHVAERQPHGFLYIDYYNSGCWTELPCSYLTVENGKVNILFVDGAT